MALVNGGGPADETEAPYTYLGGEYTLVAQSTGAALPGRRLTYQADKSGVVFFLVVKTDPLNTPTTIGTVAGQYANMWNTNAALPGVVEIAETQQVTPLGVLDDVAEVAVTSTSGKTTDILTVSQDNYRADLFAPLVAAFRSELDALEAPGG